LKGKKSIVEERIEIRKYLKIRNMEEMKGVGKNRILSKSMVEIRRTI